MQKVIGFIAFLLIKGNAYAYCYANQWTSYGPVFSSLGVTQGTTMLACQQLACQIYPGIPECGMFLQPACTNQVEYQTLSCQPHYSGAINQSRSYTCTTQTWGSWTTTSNNCTPDPPTCQTATETRQLTCQSGYNGLITETRSSVCSDPYGSPTWTSWSTTSDTCTMTATNINNPTSPISPISPTNPNSVISQQMNSVTTAPAPQIEPVTVQDVIAPTTTTTEVQNTSTSSTTSQQGNVTTTTSGTDKKENIKVPEVPKGKTLVPGFGIVMSMQFLNSGYNLQQEQMKEYINLIQEQDYERQQNIFIEFISANDTGDYLIRASANRWRSILRDNPLQRFDLDD